MTNLWAILDFLRFTFPVNGLWFIHASEPKVSYFWTENSRLKRWEAGYVVLPSAK